MHWTSQRAQRTMSMITIPDTVTKKGKNASLAARLKLRNTIISRIIPAMGREKGVHPAVVLGPAPIDAVVAKHQRPQNRSHQVQRSFRSHRLSKRPQQPLNMLTSEKTVVAATYAAIGSTWCDIAYPIPTYFSNNSVIFFILFIFMLLFFKFFGIYRL